MASKIAELRRKVAVGQYELTGHAKDEMEQDGFTINDVKAGIYSGAIILTQRHGRQAKKYVVQGRSTDRRSITIVCRITSLGLLRIITVFES